jgi:hypothetical protein
MSGALQYLIPALTTGAGVATGNPMLAASGGLGMLNAAGGGGQQVGGSTGPLGAITNGLSSIGNALGLSGTPAAPTPAAVAPALTGNTSLASGNPSAPAGNPALAGVNPSMVTGAVNPGTGATQPLAGGTNAGTQQAANLGMPSSNSAFSGLGPVGQSYLGYLQNRQLELLRQRTNYAPEHSTPGQSLPNLNLYPAAQFALPQIG